MPSTILSVRSGLRSAVVNGEVLILRRHDGALNQLRRPRPPERNLRLMHICTRRQVDRQLEAPSVFSAQVARAIARSRPTMNR